MNKKLLLGLGTIGAVAAPVAAVMACSSDNDARDVTNLKDAKHIASAAVGAMHTHLSKVVTKGADKFEVTFADGHSWTINATTGEVKMSFLKGDILEITVSKDKTETQFKHTSGGKELPKITTNDSGIHTNAQSAARQLYTLK